METTYEFSELSHEVQKIVIEGHTEYLDLIGNHKFTYEETISSLTCYNYKYDKEGNVIIK